MPTKRKSSSPHKPSTAPAPPPQTVLIAVTGLSPAVLTETIWTLAKKTAEPIIPDKIIVLTTLTGERKIKEQLFGSDDLWLTLRKQILGKNHEIDSRLDFADTPDRVRIFTRKIGGKRVQLDRIDTKEETEAVGDCLVEEIWNWIGRPDTRVLASISGGFKTMSALLYAAMTVLGNPEDRILHVLVGDPYDGGTKPLFFWPKQPEQKLKTIRPSALGAPGTPVSAGKAKLVLTDIEFPPLRQLFGDYGFKEAPTFSALVAMSRSAVVNLSVPSVSSLRLRPATFEVEVNDLPLSISKTEFLMLEFLSITVKHNLKYDKAPEWEDAYLEHLNKKLEKAALHERDFLQKRIKAVNYSIKERESEQPAKRFTSTLSHLRKKLEHSNIAGKSLVRHLPGGKPGLTLAAELIHID